MAELMENAPQTQAESVFENQPAAPAAPKKHRKKGVVKRIVAWALVLALLGGGGYFGWTKLFSKSNAEGEMQILTDTVQRGSITSVVQGSGVAVAKNSASITLISAGQVREVFVAEGDQVSEGDPLYSIDSTDVENEARRQQEYINDLQKEMSGYTVDPAKLTVKTDYAGRIVNVHRYEVGDDISEGAPVATLVDDTRLLLPLYFSYAYEKEISVGQSATISVPALMSELTGKVHEIHKVERISPEGSKLFEVVLVLDNPGTLAEEMDASATLMSGSEPIYPYESGKLQSFRTKELTAKASGTVSSASALYDYTRVSAGQTLLKIQPQSNESQIAALQNQIKTERDKLDEIYKRLDQLNAVAPIAGTVLSVGVVAGENATAGTVAVSIADTSTMIINANVDEMNVSYVKPGMMVTIDQWGNQTMGTVESISLSGQYENGVSRFPMVISVDNSEGQMMSGSYVNYSFTASQSDDCLIVPIQCVKYVETEQGTQKVLFIQADERPENTVEVMSDTADIPEGYWPVPVETGISDNYNVEILSGVEEFTTVFSSKVRENMW